jgi:tellurite resistance protein
MFVGWVLLVQFLVVYGAKAYLHPAIVVAEFRDAGRCNFLNGPHLALLILSTSGSGDKIYGLLHTTMYRAFYVVALIAQLLLTRVFYERWLFSDEGTIDKARAPYLLSTVGWFLLTALSNNTGIDAAWGLDLGAWCTGAGCFFYAQVMIAIFRGYYLAPGERGVPSLFLILAPPSIAAGGIAGLSGGFGLVSSGIFGYVLVMWSLLLRTCPALLVKPVLFGTYWAYVFPLAAAATAAVSMANTKGSVVSRVVASVMVGIASLTLIVVFGRMCVHHYGVLLGKEVWRPRMNPNLVLMTPRQGGLAASNEP